MVEFLTFGVLNEIRKKFVISESEIIKTATERIETKNLFLSYSSQNADYLPSIIKFLENHGASVYIDKGDSRLPKVPSKETAEILREEIQRLSKFVLFVTPAVKDSIWIPWELGLGDAYKSRRKVALLPVTSKPDEKEWSEQEYLGLYQRIVWSNLEGFEKPLWIIYDHLENTGIPLAKWIRGY